MPQFFAFLLCQNMASALPLGRPGPSAFRDEEDES